LRKANKNPFEISWILDHSKTTIYNELNINHIKHGFRPIQEHHFEELESVVISENPFFLRIYLSIIGKETQ